MDHSSSINKYAPHRLKASLKRMAGDSLDGKDSRDGEAYVRLRSASEDEQRKETKREKIVRHTTTVNSHREVQRY